MQFQDKPTIVIPAYNRPNTLSRLLRSVANADYEGYDNVQLIISVDKSDNTETSRIAEEFKWNHGEKFVFHHDQHLGLRGNVLFCGSLAKEYGSVILLEDDLLAAPTFYDYAVKAKKFFGNDERIAGISLYAYNYNEFARMFFFPIDDGFDNYFIKNCASWGQLWTDEQWTDFEKWYRDHSGGTFYAGPHLPYDLNNWTNQSWKKYFIKYMVENDKYFVVPRFSQTTNMAELGEHHVKNAAIRINLQVPLQYGKREYRFNYFDNSNVKYDVFHELDPECLKNLNPMFNEYDFECDIYGAKDISAVNTQYILSTRQCEKSIYSFSLLTIPTELNAIMNIKGNDLFFGERKSFGKRNMNNLFRHLLLLHKDLGPDRYLPMLQAYEGRKK